jgi:hypothetical protein
MSFWCRRFHGLLLTVGAGPGLRTGLVESVLDCFDLLWMIGKKLEPFVVVVLFRTLDPISSCDPLLS